MVQAIQYKRSKYSDTTPVLPLFSNCRLELVDVFPCGYTVEKAIESMVSGQNSQIVRIQEDILKCSGIDQIRLGWLLKRASIARATGQGWFTRQRLRRATAFSGPYSVPASPVSEIAPPLGRRSERFPGSFAAALAGVAFTQGNRKNTWPTSVW